jgi:hypothetical protein
MQEIEKIINNYLSAWNASDQEERSLLIAQIIAEDCFYADAHLPEPLIGKELHARFVNQFRDKFPELSLQLASSPDSHHDFFRFAWKLVKSDDIVFAKGSYFGEVNQQGKISKLIGFVDR